MENSDRGIRNIAGLVIGVLLLLVVWSMVTAANKNKNPGDDQGLGITEYENGNYQEAVAHYNKAIQAAPDNSSVHNNLGLAYYALRKYDEAISEYDRAIELEPDFSQAYFNRGQAYWRKGGYNDTEFLDRAVLDFTRVIELNPDDMDAYYNRGLAYSTYMHWHKKETVEGSKRSGFTPEATLYFVKALLDFQNVIDSDSTYSALAVAGRANLFYRHAEWDLAIMEYKQAIERKDEIINAVGEDAYGGIFAPMGRTYMALDDMENAYLSYATFMDLVENPLASFHDQGTGVGMGYALYTAKNQEKYETAAEWYDKRIAISEPPRTSDYFDKGFCLYKLKRYDEAIESYNTGLEASASDDASSSGYGTSEADARRYLGAIYREKGDTQMAETEFRNAIALYSKKEKSQDQEKTAKARFSRMNYEARGLCYLEIGEFENAISDFENIKKSKRNPQNYIRAQKNIGSVYQKMGKKDEAREYFEKTITLAEELDKDDGQQIIQETTVLLQEL